MNIGLPIGKESLTKQKKIFPLELRAKTLTLVFGLHIIALNLYQALPFGH